MVLRPADIARIPRRIPARQRVEPAMRIRSLSRVAKDTMVLTGLLCQGLRIEPGLIRLDDTAAGTRD